MKEEDSLISKERDTDKLGKRVFQTHSKEKE
jgi:hypothetical protein